MLEPGDYAGALKRSREALKAGVTLILDKGWRDTTTIELIDSVSEAERPDIEAAAHMIAVSDGYYPGFAREIEPSRLDRMVREEASIGAGWVKLIGDWPRRGRGPLPNFSEEDMRRAVNAAEAAGSRVAVHTMAPEVPRAAVAAGVHSIEHGLFLTDGDLADLGRRGGMWVPTIRRVETLIGQLGSESSGGRLLQEGLLNVGRLLAGASEAGVNVLTGTDMAGTPADVAMEALKLAEYGMSNSQVVQAIARSGFESTGRSIDFRPGAWANAVLLPADPVEDLPVLARPSHVIRHGAVL